MSEFSVTLNNEKEEKDNKIMSQVNILKEGIGRNENENEEIKKATEEAQKELQELEGVVKTETWISEQLKSEELLKMDKLCVSLKIPAEQYLNYFFLVTGTTFGKTPEGNLRIDIGKEERGSKFYLILQLQKGQYKILDSSTHFNPEKYEELLNSAKNFTMFICSVVANEYYSLVRGNA
ncbi:MAG: hypothetical protein MJ252_17510 [archaeon]|nr:hypothetical protein [archaeon]